MKVKNGKIVEATENELFAHYLKYGFDDTMSFPEYLKRCKELGTKVIEEKTDKLKP